MGPLSMLKPMNLKRKSIFAGILLPIALVLASCNPASSSSSSDTSKPDESTSIGEVSSSESTSTGGNVDTSSSTTSTGGDGEDSSSSSSSEEPEKPGPITLSGVNDVNHPKGQYFDVFDGVQALTDSGLDLTRLLKAKGTVDYSKEGKYTVEYFVEYEGYEASATRTITIDGSSIKRENRSRGYTAGKTVSLGEGSYLQGQTGALVRPGDPAFLGNEAYNRGAIPSSKWYSGFMYANNGGVTTAYTNPLAISLKGADGVSINHPEDGYNEYIATRDTKGRSQVKIENHPLIMNDILVKTPSINGNETSSLIDYDDVSATLSLRDGASLHDELVLTMVQGSPFAYFDIDGDEAIFNLRTAAVTKGYEFLDGNLNPINTEVPYVSSSLVVVLKDAHIGYGGTYNPPSLGSPVYDDKAYLLSVPEGSTFNINGTSINVDLNGHNFFAVAALSELDDAARLANKGLAFVRGGGSAYTVDHATATVETEISYQVQTMGGEDYLEPYIGLLPHQWKNSETPTTDLAYTTIRGQMKLMDGSSFSTHLSFHGLLPTFALPNNSSFDRSTMVSYLEELLANNKPGSDGFIDSKGPYWNAKAVYPLAIGLQIAGQLQEEELASSFKEVLKADLVDWYTYSGSTDARYRYYDEVSGTLIWSNDDFSTASRLSDHHFTASYFTYASAVLSFYDETFLDSYGEMAMLELRDYMNYDREDASFPYLRAFDVYAGHSWADGRGDAGDGNNQESSGEALHGWTAGYLMGLATGNAELVDAAIYGYVTELESVKQYWFNYDEDNWNEGLMAATHAVGMIWGSKNSYTTWFGDSPEFIYGIHWLPTGEYLSGYAMDDYELSILEKIYDEMVAKCGGEPLTWQSNMWAMEAIFDSESALSDFDPSKIRGDDYPNELSGSYYMVNALDSYGHKDSSSYVEIYSKATGSVYLKDGKRTLLAYNPSDKEEKLTVHLGEKSLEVTVAPRSLEAHAL